MLYMVLFSEIQCYGKYRDAVNKVLLKIAIKEIVSKKRRKTYLKRNWNK
jgi:hypothetical protein